MLFICSSKRPRQSPQQNKAAVTEKARADVNSHKVPDDNKVSHSEIKKPVRRNRELERLGVLPPVQQTSSNRLEPAVNESADKSNKVIPNSHSRTSEDNDNSTSGTDVDEDSETDDESSEVDVDDDETEGPVSDTDNEVIIVSEVRGKKSNSDSSSKTKEEKSVGDRGCGDSVQSKKSAVPVAADESSSSSQWMRRVKMLEATMSEMKLKFAEVLRLKVSDMCICCS